MPLKMVRRYPPYHEAGDVRDGRAAIVALRLDGWSAKATAGYLGVHHATVYRTLERWKEGGLEGLEDRPFGRPPGVRKADFAAVEAIDPGAGAEPGAWGLQRRLRARSSPLVAPQTVTTTFPRAWPSAR